jgi:hypothetical protein
MPDAEPDASSPIDAIIVTAASRAAKRRLGPTAWAVLEDVVLDARRTAGRWEATTSVRLVARHLGLTPGTVARALARLCSDGIVHREDRRDDRTGRFGESVYVIDPLPALAPCVDVRYTADRGTDSVPGAAKRTDRRIAEPLNAANRNTERPTTTNRLPQRTPHRNLQPPTTEPLNPMNQRPSNTCQPFGQAWSGRASC